MRVRLSDKIRDLVRVKYIGPAIRAGSETISIRVRDILTDLSNEGFPGKGHTPIICSALQTSKFLRENGLEIEGVEGPPSKRSPTVVIRYLVAKPGFLPSCHGGDTSQRPAAEPPTDRALRLTEKLRGILRDELSEYGGGQAFLHWVRAEDENAA
jgi:hypothetical protein